MKSRNNYLRDEAFKHTGEYPKEKNEMRNAFEKENRDCLNLEETAYYNDSDGG